MGDIRFAFGCGVLEVQGHGGFGVLHKADQAGAVVRAFRELDAGPQRDARRTIERNNGDDRALGRLERVAQRADQADVIHGADGPGYVELSRRCAAEPAGHRMIGTETNAIHHMQV